VYGADRRDSVVCCGSRPILEEDAQGVEILGALEVLVHNLPVITAQDNDDRVPNETLTKARPSVTYAVPKHRRADVSFSSTRDGQARSICPRCEQMWICFGPSRRGRSGRRVMRLPFQTRTKPCESTKQLDQPRNSENPHAG